MYKFIFSLLAICSLAMPVCAEESQPPSKQTPPTSGNKSDGIELPADQIVNNDEGFINITAKCKGTLRWLVISAVKVKYLTNDAANSIIVSVPPQGVITVFAIGLVENKLTDFVSCNITVRGPPDPDPGPNPTPTPGPLHITFALDLNNTTPELAALLNSQSMRKAVTSRGCFLRILDSKSPVLVKKKLDTIVAKVGGPTMIIQRNDGILATAPQAIPRTEAEIVAIINKIQGIKNDK